MTPQMNDTFNPNWKLVQNFEYSKDAESLKQTYLLLTVFNVKSKHRFCSMKLQLWEIAMGPTHYDLFLDSGTESKSRVTFDLKMVQKVRMKITTKSILCDLNEALVETSYNFQIKIKSHELDYESNLSPAYLNPKYAKQMTEEKLQIGLVLQESGNSVALHSQEEIMELRDDLEEKNRMNVSDRRDQIKKAMSNNLQQQSSIPSQQLPSRKIESVKSKDGGYLFLLEVLQMQRGSFASQQYLD